MSVESSFMCLAQTFYRPVSLGKFRDLMVRTLKTTVTLGSDPQTGLWPSPKIQPSVYTKFQLWKLRQYPILKPFCVDLPNILVQWFSILVAHQSHLRAFKYTNAWYIPLLQTK